MVSIRLLICHKCYYCKGSVICQWWCRFVNSISYETNDSHYVLFIPTTLHYAYPRGSIADCLHCQSVPSGCCSCCCKDMVCRSYRSCGDLVVLDLWKKELKNAFFLIWCICLILVWWVVIYNVIGNDVGREEWFWWDDVGLPHSQQMPVATPTV